MSTEHRAWRRSQGLRGGPWGASVRALPSRALAGTSRCCLARVTSPMRPVPPQPVHLEVRGTSLEEHRSPLSVCLIPASRQEQPVWRDCEAWWLRRRGSGAHPPQGRLPSERGGKLAPCPPPRGLGMRGTFRVSAT